MGVVHIKAISVITCLYMLFLQIQDVVPVTSYDTAGSFLLLGCENGSIYYIGNEYNLLVDKWNLLSKPASTHTTQSCLYIGRQATCKR